MPTPPVFDVPRLLQSVSDDSPAGPELRHGSREEIAKFLAVRDARKRAVDAERRIRDFASMSDDERAEHGEPPDSPDWAVVCRNAVEALEASKDLWVAAWLIESATRLYGFAGFRDAVSVAHGLCERFWVELHPRPEGDNDMTTRFAQLAGLDGGGSAEGTLIVPLISLPLTSARSAASFSLADYRDALELERRPPDIRSRRVEQGALSVELCDKAVAETSPEYFRTLRDDLEGAGKAYADFIGLLRKYEADAKSLGAVAFVPPSSKVRDALDECLRLVTGWGPKDTVPAQPVPGDASPSAIKATTTTGAASFAGGNVQTRQEALETLLRVAHYFRTTEPHSPVSYGLEQLVRWGRMSLPELLSELVSDESARDAVFLRTGIKREPSDE